MFGHSNQDNSDNQANNMQSFGDPVGQAPTAPSLPTMGGQASPFGNPMPAATVNPTPQPEPVQDVSPVHDDTEHMITDHGTPDNFDTPAPSTEHSPHPSGDLVDIKQQALQHLSPLVSHLDQTAEEKFRTTMMMIQATDDQSLLKAAYDSAQKIEDDKARAQALLDVINEINYFTQQNK